MSQEDSSTNAANWTEEEKNAQLDELNQEAFRMLLPTLILCVFLMTIGIPGNILVFLVYLLQFQPSTARFFIKAMAICDLITNTIAIPAMIVKISHLYKPCSLFSCETVSAASTFPVVMSNCLLVCVAFDRWRRVCLPLEWQLNTRHASQILIATIPVSAVIVLPLIFLRGERKINTKYAGLQGTICDFTSSYNKSVYGIIMLVYLFILLLLLGLAYGNICLRLYQQDKLFPEMSSLTRNHQCVNKKERMSTNSDSEVQPIGMSSDTSIKGRFRVTRHNDQIQPMYGNYADDSQQKPDIETQCNPPFLDMVISRSSTENIADITKKEDVKIGSLPSAQPLPSATPCPTQPKIRTSSPTDTPVSGLNTALAEMPSPSLSKKPSSHKQPKDSDLKLLSVLEVASTKKPEATTSSPSPASTSTECLSLQPRLSISLPAELNRVFPNVTDPVSVSCISHPVRASDNDAENIFAPQATNALTPTPLARKSQSVMSPKHEHSDVTSFAVTEEADAGVKGPRYLSSQEVRHKRKDKTRPKYLAPSTHIRDSGLPSQSKTSLDSSTSLTYSYRFSPELSVLHTTHPKSLRLTFSNRNKIGETKTRLQLLSVTTLTMLAASIICMIFYVPFIVTTLMKIDFVSIHLSALKLNMTSLAQACVLVNSVTNIFVYSVCNDKYRSEVRTLVRKCLPQCSGGE